MVEAALDNLRAGLCVLPARADEKRPALPGWKQYQRRPPTEREVRDWFAAASALCLLTGAVSGNLELIDFDVDPEVYERWRALVAGEAPGLLGRVVIERSPSGGRHVVYRCAAPVPGNRKLARRTLTATTPEPIELGGKRFTPRRVGGRYEATVTLIETRGEGGLLLCAPTPGYELEQGSFAAAPTLTEAERGVLIEAACALNETVPPPQRAPGGAPAGGRPGDDYNERGDVRQLLLAHGWVLARAGVNEYWRRPGKDRGWSATLKDRVLYVFSSNAAPFEPDRAYAPFGVYTLLEHGGDFAAAAAALRAEGYSGTDDADVDLTGLIPARLTSPPPGIVDPGPIPERLLRVPGFIDRVMEFTLSSAPYPNVALAFSGALALQSFLAGRKVATPGDLRTNLYVLALASSGAGKEFPRKVNAHVLHQVGLAGSLGDKFASGEGIQDALVRAGAMLFQTDEMDGVLRQINLDQECRRESIPVVLLTLYTSASEIYPIRVKAGQREAAHVDQPHLTLFGTATPQFFYESLSQRMLTNGFFARLIIIDVGRRGVGQTPRSARRLPEDVLATARWWAEFRPGDGDLADFHPEPRVVEVAPDAQRAIDELRATTEREYDRAEAAHDEAARTAWSRTCEHALKLALVRACSERHDAPLITAEAVAWAAEFAKHQTRRQLFLAAAYVAENPFHADCLKLVRKLRAAGGRMTRSELLRAMRRKAADFDQVVATLVQQGEIKSLTLPTKTKPAQGFEIA